MQKPSQADRWQHVHPKYAFSESKHISWIYFSTEVDLRGDTLFPSDYGNGRVDPSRRVFFSLSLSVFLPTSLCCLARLAPCYHGNKDWCGMARTTEGERRGREGRESLPAVPSQQQKPWGNLVRVMKRQEFIPNFLSHTKRTIFVLQHQRWLVLLSPPLLSQSSAPLSCPSHLLHPPQTLFSLQSLLFQPFLYPPFLIFLFFVCPSLFSSSIPPEWISNGSGLVHSGEGEL